MFGGTHQWMKNIVCFDILFFLKHTCSVRLILGFTECVFFACCSKKGISFSPHVTHRRVTLVFQERRQAKVDLEWRCGGRKRLFKETQTQEKKLLKYCELFPFQTSWPALYLFATRNSFHRKEKEFSGRTKLMWPCIQGYFPKWVTKSVLSQQISPSPSGVFGHLNFQATLTLQNFGYVWTKNSHVPEHRLCSSLARFFASSQFAQELCTIDHVHNLNKCSKTYSTLHLNTVFKTYR